MITKLKERKNSVFNSLNNLSSSAKDVSCRLKIYNFCHHCETSSEIIVHWEVQFSAILVKHCSDGKLMTWCGLYSMYIFTCLWNDSPSLIVQIHLFSGVNLFYCSHDCFSMLKESKKETSPNMMGGEAVPMTNRRVHASGTGVAVNRAHWCWKAHAFIRCKINFHTPACE